MRSSKSGFRKLAENYVLLLRLVAEESIPEIVKDFAAQGKTVSEGAIRQRLSRGRKLMEDVEWLRATVNELRKKNKRVRKFSISARLEAEGVAVKVKA